MAIDIAVLKRAWVKQTDPNCGSCCMGSIVNYARLKQHFHNQAILARGVANYPAQPLPPLMDDTANVGLFIDGVQSLGSVTAKLAQWAANHHGALFGITQVKVSHKKKHWGGLTNSLTGGDSHRPTIDPDAAYFNGHTDRILLRECSAYGLLGHFIIQTGADEFWDPNSHGVYLPKTLASVKNSYKWTGTDLSSLSMRSDACQFDVV